MFLFGAAHPKLQKPNRGGTWPNLGRLVVYPKSLNVELILQGIRTNDKKDSFYYPDHTVPTNKQFLCFLTTFQYFFDFCLPVWESLDILPLNSFSLSQSDGICCLQQVPDIIMKQAEMENRQTWKISFKICFITRSLSYLFKEPTFATGILWTASQALEYHQIHWLKLNSTGWY